MPDRSRGSRRGGHAPGNEHEHVRGALADEADTLDIDLVAMSSYAHTGSARLALGSVMMGVVGMACRVLVTRTL